ncbi:DUF418 domain-containing protein [Microbacterium invictum]|uniref:DUF418 domain-containing protein n=1 Tax=Microbacterium invictum TaxID=515415 RepID=A0ABZ0VAF4_9MICO|nr:DUF418 domain-containing protein [Microbacterium invictum]WQB69676.1 DUF418 domain-containing protein [Microbacterium invictum]
MTAAASPRSASPTSLTTRLLAPDLARGAMLLFIAVANAPWYLWGVDKSVIASHPAEGSPADLVAQTIAIIAIDGRSYPMFAFLFGYGIVQLYRRQAEAGVSHADARRLLRRRHLWMIVFGFVHALLLWYGDIVGAYGLAGLVICWLFLDRRDAVLRTTAIVLVSLLGVFAVFSAVGGALTALFLPSGASDAGALVIPNPNGEPSYLLSMVLRLSFWAVLTPATAFLGLVVPAAILLAFLAARHSVLEDPAAHRRLLQRTAIIGITVGWGTGAILAAQNLGLFGFTRDLDFAFVGLHTLGGLFGGLGYVAAFTLLAARLSTRPAGPGAIGRALQATGKRSLTSYLAQSVLFAPVLCAWGLGLGDDLSSWSVALYAVGVWLVTVVFAVILERAHTRGPAEWMLRKLTYP